MSNFTWIDIFLLAVLAGSAFKAYRDGFFTSVVRRVGNLGSLFVAWYVSANYSRIIFEKLFRASLLNKSYDYLLQTSENIDVQSAVESIIGKWPQGFADSLIQKTQESLSVVLTPDMDSAALLVDQFLAPVITSAISIVMFIICFTAASLLCRMLAKTLKIVNGVPLLGFANRLAGLGAGVIIGGVNIILLSFLFSIIIILTGNSLSFLNRRTLQQSSIIAIAGSVNPFLP